MNQFLVRCDQSDQIIQVPANITSSQLKILFNLDDNVFLYVNGNMIIESLEKSLKDDINTENVKIINIVKEKGSQPAEFCSSVISGHTGPVLACLQFTYNKIKYFVTAGSDKTVRFWDLITKTQFKVNINHNHWVLVLEELEDYIISGGMDSIICVYDKSGNFVQSIHKFTKGVIKLVKIKQNEFVAGGRDGLLCYFKIVNNKNVEIINIYRYSSSVSDIKINNHMIVSSYTNGIVKLFTINTMDYIKDLDTNNVRINCIGIFQDIIIIGDDLGHITIYKDTKVLFRMSHKREVISIDIDPNGFNFISGSFDKTIKGWSLQTGKCLFTIYHVNYVYKIKYLNDLVISAGKDKLIKIYKPSINKIVGSFVTKDEIYDFVCDNKNIIAVSKDSNVYFYSST